MLGPFLVLTVFILTNISLVLLFPLSVERFLLVFVIYTPGTLFILYVLFYPRSRLLVLNRSAAACGENKCVALTFDDGPARENTLTVIRILREKKVKATFFIIGNRARENADILLQAVADGHLVANHTFSHPNLFCFLSPRRLQDEIEKCQDVLKEITSIEPRYFRPPAGLKHILLSRYLRRAKLEYISWRLRVFDTFVQKPERMKQKILSRVHSGDVILLHDGNHAGVKQTIAMLPGLIDELKERGFKFVLP